METNIYNSKKGTLSKMAIEKALGRLAELSQRNLWTHTSTAIEGNTLSLGETAFVIEEGLCILSLLLTNINKPSQSLIRNLKFNDFLDIR